MYLFPLLPFHKNVFIWYLISMITVNFLSCSRQWIVVAVLIFNNGPLLLIENCKHQLDKKMKSNGQDSKQLTSLGLSNQKPPHCGIEWAFGLIRICPYATFAIHATVSCQLLIVACSQREFAARRENMLLVASCDGDRISCKSCTSQHQICHYVNRTFFDNT